MHVLYFSYRYFLTVGGDDVCSAIVYAADIGAWRGTHVYVYGGRQVVGKPCPATIHISNCNITVP